MSTILSDAYDFLNQGVTPDYVDPYTRGPLLLALSAVAIGIMYLFLGTRFYTKLCILHKLTWDDLTSTVAALLSTGICVLLFLMERHGMGTHQRNVRYSELMKDSYLKPLYLSICLTPLIALFTKLSFYILYFQIFSVKPLLKWSIYIGAIITIVFYLVITIILFVLLTPRPGTSFFETFLKVFLNKTSPALNTTFALSYFNILSDLYIMILPISAVMRLNLRKRRKFGVIIIFLTALLAVFASSVSLYFRYQNNNSGDTTWNMMFVGYSTIVEHTIGVICSCMPACSVAMRRSFPLLVGFKMSLTTGLRRLNTRFLLGSWSRARILFGLNEGKLSSSDDQEDKRNSNNQEVPFFRNLPEVPQHTHRMLTARAFIWGGKSNTSTTVNEEINSTSSSSV